MTDQDDQRVLARSVRPRLDVCWQGRHDIRAVIAGSFEPGWEEFVVGDICGFASF